jgi:hypothetical protein
MQVLCITLINARKVKGSKYQVEKSMRIRKVKLESRKVDRNKKGKRYRQETVIENRWGYYVMRTVISCSRVKICKEAKKMTNCSRNEKGVLERGCRM